MKITLSDAKKVGNKLGINFRVVPVKYFQYGMQIEAEHGGKNKLTNVTHDNKLKTGKIALVHILEYPDYYIRLKKLEEKADKEWKNKERPKILR